MSFATLKNADSGGWVLECFYLYGENKAKCETHIAATPEDLVDHVLAFAARTDASTTANVATLTDDVERET